MADNSYSAGELKLELLGYSESAIASIDRTVKSLNALARSLNNVNQALPISSADTLSIFFQKIAKATDSINNDKLDKLVASSKAIANISKIGNLGKMDFSKVGDGFGILSQKIEPFLAKVKEAEASLTSLNSIMSKSGKLSNITDSSKKDDKKSGKFSFLNLAKWTAVIHTAKKLGRAVYKVAEYGANFTETLNMWSVAMGKDLLPQATAFVNKLSEAYGISKETLMNAQATFKNMLGSLGNISDQQAYIMSEGITQMALDYASLYNQSFEDAFTKFQAALAGQVRPIRSVSGFDITETTLADLYESLGGEKSIRQLNRTEKQLLSILAIYQQMDKTGAQGDLERTINTFANQSRVAKDQMKEILTYSGAILTKWLNTSGVMSKFVGVLIFISDVLEEVAKSKGALEQEDSTASDPLGNVTQSANEASDAIDEVQGKLLGFDKFRALDESDKGGVSIDQTLIDALAKYQSVLGNVDMKANDFADTLKEMSDLFDEDGAFNPDSWQRLVEKVENFGTAILIAFSPLAIEAVGNFAKNVFSAKEGFGLLDALLIGGAIFHLQEAVDAFKDGDTWAGIFATTVGVTLVGAFVLLNKTAILSALTAISNFIGNLIVANITTDSMTLAIVRMSLQFVALAAVIAGAWLIFKNWGDMNTFQKIASVMGLVTVAAFGLAMALGAVQSAWSIGIAAAGIAAGIAAISISIAKAKKQADEGQTDISLCANGGLPDKGSMFIAGEAGAEFVYNMPNGQSGVANIQQIAQATYNGTIKALNDWWGGSQARGDIPQLQEANATGMYQAVTGVAKSYGEKWSKY